MPDPRRRMWLALVLSLLVVASACVEQPPHTVVLQDVQADIVFGVKPAEPPIGPANIDLSDQPIDVASLQQPPVPRDDILLEEEEVDDGPDVDDKRFLSRLPPPPPAAAACPDAELTEFADEPASLTVVGRPAGGLYRWKISGTQELVGPPAFKIPVNAFEKRLIRKVTPISDVKYTFEMVQPDNAKGEVVVTTFQVRSDAAIQPVAALNGRIGEPDRGLSIVKIERFEAVSGNPVGRPFAPQPPVLVLPLPVVPGEKFRGVGVDPTTFQALDFSATVTKRQTVDACGELVDGWLVEGTRTFTSRDNPGTPQDYKLIIATQFGAVPISESVKTRSAQGLADLTFSLGQVVPDPVPAAAG